MGLGSFKARWWKPVETTLGLLAAAARELVQASAQARAREKRIRWALENIAKQPCRCSLGCEPCDPCLAGNTLSDGDES
jgi:hypothetical protein